MRYGKTQLRSVGFILALAFLMTSGLSLPAQADKGGNGHGNKGKHERNIIVIDKDDRQVIRHYLKDKNCLPGLAKKRNGCLPPGQAKKYEIGQRLPSDVRYSPLPYSLARQLRPLGPTYEYVVVDDDVLLMSKKDQTIIDAITVMSALAQ